jgi:hypothetical protein
MQSKEETVANQAIEFWSTLADVEDDIEYDDEIHMQEVRACVCVCVCLCATSRLINFTGLSVCDVAAPLHLILTTPSGTDVRSRCAGQGGAVAPQALLRHGCGRGRAGPAGPAHSGDCSVRNALVCSLSVVLFSHTDIAYVFTSLLYPYLYLQLLCDEFDAVFPLRGLTPQAEDEDDSDEWNTSKAASVCLNLLGNVVRDELRLVSEPPRSVCVCLCVCVHVCLPLVLLFLC